MQTLSQPGTHVVLLQPRVLSRRLWESEERGGGAGWFSFLPGLTTGTVGGKGLIPLLLVVFAQSRFCLSSGTPHVQMKGSCLARAMPLRPLFSWCYSQFRLGSTEAGVFKTQQEAPFCVIHCHNSCFKYLRNRTL